MGEVIWVEVLSRHRDVAARYRCAGPEIRIGRGYDNDVVIDDPYVAPQHLRIVRDPDGSLVAEDCGSANGLSFDHREGRHDRLALDGHRPIRIGHTWLQIRDANHAVAPERVAAPAPRRWPLLAALAVVIIALEVLSAWQHDTAEFKLSRYLTPVVEVSVLVGAWTFVWVVLSRIFAHEAHFGRTLLIALAGMLTFSLYNEVSTDLAFSLSWAVLARYQYVAMWLVLGAACFLHLRELGRVRLALKGGIVAAGMALAIAMQTLAHSELPLGDDQRSFGSLLPPALRLRPLQTEDAFFGKVEQLKTRLEKAREDPSE
jgi:hypothetical protein